MKFIELQKALKQLRSEGKIPATFKLNQKKEILQAMWQEVNAAEVKRQAAFDKADRDARKALGKCIATNTVVLYDSDHAIKHGLNYDEQVKEVLDFMAETVERYKVTGSLFHVFVTELDSPHGVRSKMLTYAD